MGILLGHQVAVADANKRWLHQRLAARGGSVNPAASFQGTANWMRALAILCADNEFTVTELEKRYAKVKRRAPIHMAADTCVFESILMSFQNLAATTAMSNSKHRVDLTHTAVIAWYYGIYNAASAMIAANDGSVQTEHQKTAHVWDRQLVQNQLVPAPFGFRCSSLVRENYRAEVAQVRNGREAIPPHHTPRNSEEAESICLSHLSGTAEYERDRHENFIRADKMFKKLDVVNFRTKAARAFRDKWLQNKSVGFLHQAIRHRGKANYRDVLYLSYGTSLEDQFEGFVENLRVTSEAYLRMAVHYCARRIERGSWDKFVRDVEENSRLNLSIDVLGA